MTPIRHVLHAWRNLTGHRRLDRELDEEMHAVRELLIEEKTRAGELVRDAIHAVRAYRRTPGFTAVVLLTLALGIVATTAIFSVVNGILLKPLPYPESDRLIALTHALPTAPTGTTGSAMFLHFVYQDESETFTSGRWTNSFSASVTGLAEPEQVGAVQVTHQILPILGVPPLGGRVFSAEDDTPGSPLTTVLTHPYWQRRFGGDPSAIGQSLTIDGRPHEIVGVMPPEFRFLDRDIDLLRPLQPDRERAQLGNFNASGVARLRPGVTLEQAGADVARMIAIAMETAPVPRGGSREMFRREGLRPNLRPLKESVVGNVGDTLWVLLGTVGLVLLVACANVANLLVRAEGRRQELELALRAAMGAASHAACWWRASCSASPVGCWGSAWPSPASACWWQAVRPISPACRRSRSTRAYCCSPWACRCCRDSCAG